MPRLTPRNTSPAIKMFFKDTDNHKEPHFHIATAGEAVSVAIEDFRILKGSMRPKDLKKGLGWASDNIALIRMKWNEFNPHQPIEE